MQIKIKFSLFLLAAFAVMLGITQSASADYTAKKDTVGNMIIYTTLNNDYVNSPLPPNTNVTVTFLITDKNNPSNYNLCPSGKNMYAYLKHWTGDAVDYPSEGQKITFSANFNSGAAGQVNKVASIFVCAPDYVPGDTTLGSNLQNLESQGFGWESYPLSITTAAATTIVFNPMPTGGYYATGTTVQIVGQNMPASSGTALCGSDSNNPNYKFTVKLNGQSTTFFCLPYSFTVKSDAVEGTIDMSGGSNNLETFITDKNGNPIAQASVSFKVGQAASGNTPSQPGTTASGSSSSLMQNNSATTLYNPISGVDNLTDLLLRIMQGFLAIIGVWSVAFIVIGGFQMVISQGNEEAVLKAKKTIIWAVGGLVIAILAFSIIAIVQNLIGINIQNVSTFIYHTLKIA